VHTVAVYSFPGDTFTVEGDPEAVRESGRAYGRFAGIAAEAAEGLRGLESGAWVGTEGDLFRAQVAELPLHLDVARGAFGQVAGALDGFADALVIAQRQMATVRSGAEQTFGALAGARADNAGLADPPAEADTAARAAHDEHRSTLEARIGRLEASWADQLATAGGVRARLLEAAGQAGRRIRAAARTSPTADQGWLEDRWDKTRRWASERVDDLKGFMAEHAAAFRSMAKVLRVVGVALVAVGAVLAVLGVGGAVMAAGAVLWGGGDALEATVAWAEGGITGRQLLVSASLSIGLAIVGGGAAKVGAKTLQELAPRVHGLVNLARTGSAVGAGGRLPQDMGLVKQIAAKAGVGLDGVKLQIHRSAPRQGMFGQTTPDGVLHLFPNAFRNEEELVRTLGHERTHVWQVKTYGYPTQAEAGRFEEAARATEAQWWDYYQMSTRP
jgi:hypothetical protein